MQIEGWRLIISLLRVVWNGEVKILKIDCSIFRLMSGKSLMHCPTPGCHDMAGPLVRSGTSPAANYAEACAAESQPDFIHQLGIGLKELRESRSWIKLILKSEFLPAGRILPLLDKVEQLCDIIGKSIVTAKANQQKAKGSPNSSRS